MIKRIILSLLVCFTLGSLSTSLTFADNSDSDIYNAENHCDMVLGLVPWDCGVVINDQETLSNGIWTVAANVAADITVVGTYLALGFVIYGGYLYMFSAGDSTRITTSKKVLPQAFIGLAIVLTAHIILVGIRIALLSGGDFSNCAKETCVDPSDMVTSTIQWVVGMAGVVAVIFIVYGGISYTTSAGDPNKLQKAKQIIMYALIGLAIVILAEIITAFASNVLNESMRNTQSYFYNQKVISKENNNVKIN